MKTALTLLFFIFLLQIAKSQDVIIMKNGDEIKSKILEVTTNEVKYKKEDNPDGPVYTMPKSDMFMIKYANGTKDVFSNDKTAVSQTTTAAKDSVAKKKVSKSKYTNITEFGYAGGVGSVTLTSYNYNYNGGITPYTIEAPNDLKIVRFTTVNAVQVNDYFAAGLGVGLHYYWEEGSDGHAVTMPVYLDLRSKILGNQLTPVVFFDAGFSIKIHDANYLDGLMMEPGVGINIPVNNVGVNFSVSYIMQKASIPDYGLQFYGYSYDTEKYTLKYFSFKFGIAF